MKRFLLSVVLATSLALTSCEFDDSDIQRISALEELCKQMNTNIEALQTLVDALEKRDYVTNVSKVYSNGEVIGYTISFGDSDSITIYHGKDGADGKDGYTPQIGVMKDSDGIYYWTLDGEWLLDEKGDKIQANGVNGTNGVTPQLKIENDYWYVSYDNGATWVQLGKATGEDGKDGQDSFIIGVEESETEVVFILSNNTTITLPKHVKSSLTDPNDICTAMDDVKFMEYCYQNFDVNKDGKVSPVEAKSVRSIDISGLEVYSITGVEYFEILEILKAENTPLRNVDLSFSNKLVSFSFYNCSSITSIVLPKHIAIIAESAFSDCSKLVSITIPDSVTSIGNYAFEGCRSLTSVTIPDSVTSIGNFAFEGCCSLTSVTIPDSVTSIGYWAFADCTSLKAFYGKFASTDNRCLIVDGILKSFAPAGLTEYTIPNSVTSIDSYAFADCCSLTSVTIPDSVTSIGNSSFRNCTSLKAFYGKFASTDNRCLIVDGVLKSFAPAGLTEYTIPNSVTSIGSYAFVGCRSLTSVTIPSSVTSIGDWAFCSCTSLTSVHCKPTTPPAGGLYMFDDNAFNRKIYVPRNSVNAYKASTYWTSYASYIVGYDF